jgi:hypothetical protein
MSLSDKGQTDTIIRLPHASRAVRIDKQQTLRKSSHNRTQKEAAREQKEYSRPTCGPSRRRSDDSGPASHQNTSTGKINFARKREASFI